MDNLVYSCNMCKITIMSKSLESLIKKGNEHEQSNLHINALNARLAPIYPEKQQEVSNNVA
jgi:hypothetical protein